MISRGPVALAIAVAMLLGGCGGSTDQRDAIAKSPDLMIVGDSISAHWRYDATGTGEKAKAWWAYVADAAGIDANQALKVRVDAIPGTGMLATGPADRHAVRYLDGLGEACGDGTSGRPSHSFGARLDNISITHPPKVLVIEGGRNDFKNCVDGVTRLSTVAESKAAIDRYLEALAARAQEAGIAPDHIFVVTPWGPSFSTERRDITPLVEAAAGVHGFRWIPTPELPAAKTVDNTHPNAAGTRWLARQIESGSDIVAQLED